MVEPNLSESSQTTWLVRVLLALRASDFCKHPQACRLCACGGEGASVHVHTCVCA